MSDVTLDKTLTRNVSPARQIPLPNLRDVTLIVCTPEKWDVVNPKLQTLKPEPSTLNPKL